MASNLTTLAWDGIEEINRNWTFVFFGYGLEYVLNPLYQYMKGQRFDCVEIDTSRCEPLPIFQAIRSKGKNVALISSQHFYYGKGVRDHFGINGFYNPMEAAASLDAKFICWCPHDLINPIADIEIPYLGCVDLYLAAEERELILSRYCDVSLVGWMKAKSQEDFGSIELRNGAIWFFSGAWFLCRDQGFERGCDLMAESFADLCSVKYPLGFNHEKLEKALSERGAHVISAEVNSTALIRSADVVISNGPSSTVREANLLGKSAIVICDDRIWTELDANDLWKLVELPNLKFVTSLREIDWEKSSEAAIPGDSSLADGVDLDHVTRIILSKISAKSKRAMS